MIVKITTATSMLLNISLLLALYSRSYYLKHMLFYDVRPSIGPKPRLCSEYILYIIMYTQYLHIVRARGNIASTDYRFKNLPPCAKQSS